MYLILGYSDLIGKRLVKLLSKKSRCIVYLRKKRKIQKCKNVKFIFSKKINNGLLSKLTNNVHTIFNCVGETKNEKKMHNTNFMFMKIFLDYFLNNKKKIKWIQLSSAGVYGPPSYADQERFLKENIKNLFPLTVYEKTKLLSENLLKNEKYKKNITYSILRPTQIISKNMKNNSVRDLVKSVKKRCFFYIGFGKYFRHYVHADDVVNAMILCKKKINKESKNEVFNLSQDIQLETLIKKIINKNKINFKPYKFPIFLTRILVTLCNFFGIKIPLTHNRINNLVSRTRYPSDKIQKKIKFKFSVNPVTDILNY